MNNKIRLQIKKELKFIYTQIDILNAYNPYRTTETDRDRISKAETRCYMLTNICEALEADDIISHELYMDVWQKCSELLNELTRQKNNILSA